jgi:DNA-binding XRE family transcriptional regulator
VNRDVDPILTGLRDRRRELGVTQQLLARAMGTAGSPNLISSRELGHRSPTLAFLRRWADALGCEIALVPLDTDGEAAHDPVRLLTHAQRRAELRRLANGHLPARELAARVGVSTRTAHRAREIT